MQEKCVVTGFNMCPHSIAYYVDSCKLILTSNEIKKSNLTSMLIIIVSIRVACLAKSGFILFYLSFSIMFSYPIVCAHLAKNLA